MALIGGIDIALRAQTGNVNKQLKSAGNSFTSFAAKVNSAIGLQAAGFGQLITARLGAIGAAKEFVLNSAHEIDQANDLSQRIGITAQQMRELEYATKLTGSETENLGPALMKMNNNLSDAARAGGPVADSLKRIGLDAKQLAKLNPDVAFLKIAGAIQRVGNTTDQTAVAMDVFGKTGAQLLNTFNAGPEELDRLTKKFQDLRGEISQDDANVVGAMFDSFDNLGAVVAGLGDRLAIEFAPRVSEMIDLFIDWASEGMKTGGIIDTAINGIGDVLDTVGVVVRNWPDVWEIAKLSVFEKIANIIDYLGVIPPNLKIIGDYVAGNWKTLITDALQAVGRLILNINTNFTNLAASIFNLFRTGEWKFDFTPLLDGFEATTKELPKLLAPELTSMQDQIDAAGKRISDNEQKRRDEMDAEDEKGPNKAKPAGLIADKAKKEKFNAGAFTLGSKEAYSAILKFQGGGKDKTAENTSRLVKLGEEQLRETKKANTVRSFGINVTSSDLYKLPA